MNAPGDRPAGGLPMFQPGTIFAGYRIDGLLDRGGMGMVYRATDVDLDRSVALKIIAPEHVQNETAVARFKVEARLAASLEHPHIVPIFRGGEYEGVLYLAMRLVPGSNLREVIARNNGPLELRRVLRITTEIADALDAAHRAGLVHRDVKPGNILVSGEGPDEHVYLTDFGLTKRLGSFGDLTRTGAWVGTPDYVAPEQIQDRKVDGRADVYSLGCVVYEMLTGRVAYPKGSDVAKLWAHVTDPPPAPRETCPDLVEAFDELVARATAKDPDDRFPTASALAVGLSGAVSEQEAHRRRKEEQPKPVLAAPSLSTRAEIGGAGSPGGAAGDPVHAATAASAPREDLQAAPAGTPPPPPRPAVGAPVANARRRDGRQSQRGGWMSRHRLPVLAALALLACVVVAAVVLSGGGSDSGGAASAAKGDKVPATLRRVPLNHATGSGDVDLRLDGRVATVTVHAKGLVGDAVHPMHIHAGAIGKCPDTTAARLHNGHRVIAAHDGGPFYGPPVTSLTRRGDTSADSVVAFSRYPNTARIDYSRKIRVSAVVASQIRENNAVVVIHGVDYNRNGLYDNSLDRSDLNRSLPGESTLPDLCGTLRGKKTAKSTKKNAAVTEYRASLVDAGDDPTWRWICDLHGTPDAIL